MNTGEKVNHTNAAVPFKPTPASSLGAGHASWHHTSELGRSSSFLSLRVFSLVFASRWRSRACLLIFIESFFLLLLGFIFAVLDHDSFSAGRTTKLFLACGGIRIHDLTFLGLSSWPFIRGGLLILVKEGAALSLSLPCVKPLGDFLFEVDASPTCPCVSQHLSHQGAETLWSHVCLPPSHPCRLAPATPEFLT